MRLADEGLVRVLPRLLSRRFDPSAAVGLDAELELRVGGSPLAVRVAGGRCTVRRGPAASAGAQVEIAPRELVGLALGELAWPRLLSEGRMRLSGDPFLALRFPPLFRLAASAGPPAGDAG